MAAMSFIKRAALFALVGLAAATLQVCAFSRAGLLADVKQEALERVCADTSGHLSERQIVANYARFKEAFAESEKLATLISESWSEFSGELAKLNESERVGLLKAHTSRICGIVASLAEVIQSKRDARGRVHTKLRL